MTLTSGSRCSWRAERACWGRSGCPAGGVLLGWAARAVGQAAGLGLCPPSREAFTVAALSPVRYIWRFHDREGFSPRKRQRSFVIITCLAWPRARKSHSPPQAHSPRILGALMADHCIVCTYLSISIA